ncbi:SRPBCC domain-containing protein, partial [Microbacterium lacticum]
MNELDELSFTVSGYIARPPAEVYEAVADPQQLSRYFTTGGARGRLENGAAISWEFADSPGRFPVTVVEADPPRRLVIRWEGTASLAPQTTT